MELEISMGNTRERILDSACHIFAEVEIHDANVADICKRAEANIASVNYHYGSKGNLYTEVLWHAFAVAEAEYPIVSVDDAASSPHAQLRGLIDAQFRRIVDPDIAGCASKLTAHEMANPTLAHKDVFRNVMAPWVRQLDGIIAAIVGKDAPKDLLRHCSLSVVSLFAFYQSNTVAREAFLGRKCLAQRGAALQAFAHALERAAESFAAHLARQIAHPVQQRHAAPHGRGQQFVEPREILGRHASRPGAIRLQHPGKGDTAARGPNHRLDSRRVSAFRYRCNQRRTGAVISDQLDLLHFFCCHVTTPNKRYSQPPIQFISLISGRKRPRTKKPIMMPIQSTTIGGTSCVTTEVVHATRSM